MKLKIYLTVGSLALATLAVSQPAHAATSELALDAPFAPVVLDDDGSYDVARRGRGRGGRDRDDRRRRHGSRSSDDDFRSGSGRRKPRIPGGSGCDDPGDILEHPECSVQPGVGVPPNVQLPPMFNGIFDSGSGRRKPRIPGGSGCDDPRDILEHPECRP